MTHSIRPSNSSRNFSRSVCLWADWLRFTATHSVGVSVISASLYIIFLTSPEVSPHFVLPSLNPANLQISHPSILYGWSKPNHSHHCKNRLHLLLLRRSEFSLSSWFQIPSASAP